jgi:hypothetical protein
MTGLDSENPTPALEATDYITSDFRRLHAFHSKASRDWRRTPKLRRWHADQARRVAAKATQMVNTSFDWKTFCAWGEWQW